MGLSRVEGGGGGRELLANTVWENESQEEGPVSPGGQVKLQVSLLSGEQLGSSWVCGACLLIHGLWEGWECHCPVLCCLPP